MREQIRLLGILNIVWSSISILIGLLILLVFGGLAGFLATAGIGSSDHSEFFVAPFMAAIGVFIVLLLAAISLPALIGGIALVKMKPWSRVLMIVVSIFHLFSFPIGTALGVYGLWVLFHDETRRLFGVPVPYVPPGPPAPPILPAA
jgi:hypothetical protein